MVVTMFTGCTVAQISPYLQKKFPYTHRFYADYDKALASLEKTLADLGWVIEKQVDPSVYEEDTQSAPGSKGILIITEIRQTALFLGTRHAKMNIILRSSADVSEIELRYVTVTTLPFKTFVTYKNDSAAERFFGRFDQVLDGK
jgi:hypothetical protein